MEKNMTDELFHTSYVTITTMHWYLIQLMKRCGGRGFQYTNQAFHNKLESAGITQSMSRVAKCIDNGPMAGFWGILKREHYYRKRFTDKETLIKMIEDYIDYYNNKHLQRNLGVLTPIEKHEIYLHAA